MFIAAGGLAQKPQLLAHYMPWYASKEISGAWGWHWTMNHFDPASGKAASKFTPLIGFYDSNDSDVVEYHALLMKLAGIDGVLLDWYGREDHFDYAINHRNCQRLIDIATRLGLKFAVVYEDQTVPQLIKGGKYRPEDAITKGNELMRWLEDHWFKNPSYLRWDGKPVFLVFGPQYYKDEDWTALFAGISAPAYFSLLNRRGPATGGYGWMEPQVGEEKSWLQLQSFYSRGKAWPAMIGIAYPRFDDIYKEAGVGPGYGHIGDHDGATFRRTLEMAYASKAPFIQIGTWNDWGEGTQIEPSKEFGYRDLETLQRRSHVKYSAADLRLPLALYKLRKSKKDPARADRIARMIADGKVAEARRALGL
jgi:hypothetical protein